MQSFTRHGDPTLSEDDLSHLSRRLEFRGGWGFRAELLDQDLAVSSRSSRTGCTSRRSVRWSCPNSRGRMRTRRLQHVPWAREGIWLYDRGRLTRIAGVGAPLVLFAQSVLSGCVERVMPLMQSPEGLEPG